MKPYLRPLPLLLFLTLLTCHRASRYDFPVAVDTRTRPIELQERRSWTFGGLTVDNQFPAARLNGLTLTADTLLTALILPENEPINASPWYALRLTSDRARTVTVRLTYAEGVRHRYAPKLSVDRRNWTPAAYVRGPGEYTADVRVPLAAGQPTFLAAQEIHSSADVTAWAGALAAAHPQVRRFSAGRSKLKRDLPAFSLSAGPPDDRPTIVLLSRQHPPEVTGYLALQAFVEGLLDHPELTEFLTRYQLMVYPLLNPDGVDLGHWRHTAGGIDGNRDWARYRQPETRQIANGLTELMRATGSRVVLGLDFHSTYNDVYYTHNDAVAHPLALPGLKDAWLRALEERLGGGFRVNEEAEPIGKPTTMSWFRTQFGAEGITYEIGDNTDRAFVRRKGRASAAALVEVLLRE